MFLIEKMSEEDDKLYQNSKLSFVFLILLLKLFVRLPLNIVRKCSLVVEVFLVLQYHPFSVIGSFPYYLFLTLFL